MAAAWVDEGDAVEGGDVDSFGEAACVGEQCVSVGLVVAELLEDAASLAGVHGSGDGSGPGGAVGFVGVGEPVEDLGVVGCECGCGVDA